MYQWIVFLHILGALVFFMAHGVSAMMALRLPKEQSVDHIRTILDLSNAALPVSYLAVLVLVLAGIIAGIMGNWFSRGWIWISLALMVILWFGMHAYAFLYYTPIRKAVGLSYKDREGEHPPEPPASEAEIMVLVQASGPGRLWLVSLGLVAIILALMIFKPF